MGVTLMKSFLRDEGGATSIEYALIGTLIAVAVVSGAMVIGTTLNTTFSWVGSQMTSR
jgi:pilus assembly protein Flp/PilA